MTDAMAWCDARAVAHAAASPLASEPVALHEAGGRCLAHDLVATIDVPHFASSAMDGWVVAGPGPWHLVSDGPLAPGTAAPVLTGGPIPAGADGVLRSELGVADGELLRRSPGGPDGEPGPGTHVRPAGEEAGRGDVLVAAGTILSPVHLAVAASGGVDRVDVAARPRVVVLTTGDEVVRSGMPGPGRVRDSFGPMLPGLIGSLGGVVVALTSIGDDTDAVCEHLRSLPACDLVVTTGGTGHSDADHLRPALARLGAEIVVGSLAVRPGGPGLLARLPQGDPCLVGLPGNPLAAVAGLLTLGAPLIAGLAGRAPTEPWMTVAAEPVEGRASRTSLVPALLHDGRAAPTRWRGAGMLRGLADADVLLVVPPSGTQAGHRVPALDLPWRSGALADRH